MKEIIHPNTSPTELHNKIIFLDKNNCTEYKTSRILAYKNELNFDFYKHLWDLVGIYQDRRIEVLEGGCGEGRALEQLKSGKIDFYHQFIGLGDKIRTTGITLSPMHAEIARQAPEEVKIDELIVGPIENYVFDRQYDFIYDSYGAIFWFPQETTPIYSKILNKGNLAFLRFSVTKPNCKNGKELLRENGFSIVSMQGKTYSEMTCLVQKN